MSAHGNDPAIHRIEVDGDSLNFVCLGDDAAACHHWPDCECESWDPEIHHGENATPGHEDVQQPHCWLQPWFDAAEIDEMYDGPDWPINRSEFRPGPIEVSWDGDAVLWHYAAEVAA